MISTKIKINLINIYWLIHICFFLLLSINKNSIYTALYLTMVFSLTVIIQNSIVKRIGLILQIPYAIYFLYVSIYGGLSDRVIFDIIIIGINTLNFMIPILSLYFIKIEKKPINWRVFNKISLSILFAIISIWGFDSFYLKKYEALKRITSGDLIIEKISEFELNHKRLPNSLEELKLNNKDINGFFYDLDTSSNNYQLYCDFEHWFNRRNKNTQIRIYSVESVEYDSKTKKWTHHE